MTKKELMDMIKDLPDDTEFGVRSNIGSIESNFKIIEIFGGANKHRRVPIDYIFESINNERDEK